MRKENYSGNVILKAYCTLIAYRHLCGKVRRMSFKFEKGTQVLRDAAAEFVSRESNRKSLITVTSLSLSNDFSKATVLISVYPEKAEKEALDFLKRKRGELRTYLGKKIKTKRIPFVDFEIDTGEKERRRLDEIL